MERKKQSRLNQSQIAGLLGFSNYSTKFIGPDVRFMDVSIHWQGKKLTNNGAVLSTIDSGEIEVVEFPNGPFPVHYNFS